ncbi:putative phosphorylase [Cladophialophora carrionii]|uniref:Putative phosphorylase n=1 Tax=Cladophialophora carrionii TaxID=86049 RepID=A0A1C1CWS7_9EURO|nr:putative phosphorylase [Cladophialophora carrionii]
MLFDKTQILADFDDLVARQIVLYGPASVISIRDKAFQFEFRICPALASKPATVGATENAAFDTVPKYGPGSDLADADPKLVVSKIHDTHLLVMNRFAVFRPQYLILTLDSFRRQTESLDRTDLAAAWAVMQALPDEHFVMFNCGNEAGCSRLHKHMQVIPYSTDVTLFPDQAGLNPMDIPFKYFIRPIDSSIHASPGRLHAIYCSLHGEALQAWQSCTETTLEYFPHNVMLTKRWIMVVPRRRAAFQGASANAAGMMGMVWLTNPRQLDRWKEIGPSRVLEELGVPNRRGQPAKNTSSSHM